MVRRHHLHERVGHVLLSCVFGSLDPEQVVKWMLEDAIPAKFQLQMHKYIWDPKAQGV